MRVGRGLPSEPSLAREGRLGSDGPGPERRCGARPPGPAHGVTLRLRPLRSPEGRSRGAACDARRSAQCDVTAAGLAHVSLEEGGARVRCGTVFLWEPPPEANSNNFFLAG